MAIEYNDSGFTEWSCPLYHGTNDVAPEDEPVTSLMMRYRVAGKDGINAFSQWFYNFAFRNGITTDDENTYFLGPKDKQVRMAIGRTDTVPEVVFDAHSEKDIKAVVSIFNGWEVGLEEITKE
ncbi:hypothetical protein J4447_03535 [Candidatus Pacearchaeota archaeon]|nr:hypothetical protein [Candidatus Pacearchaeota archaeon]